MGLNLAIALKESARRHPDRPMVKLGDFELNYAQLDAMSDRMAGWLVANGVEPGDRVGIMLPNVPQFPIAYYGVLKAGAAVVPMNVLLKAREVAYYLEDSGAKAFVAWEGFLEDALGGAESAGVSNVVVATTPGGDAGDALTFEQALGGAEPIAEMAQRQADDPAVLLYTSGTTGKPKGAVLTHSNILWNTQMSSDTLIKLEPEDVIFGALPLFHSFGQVVGMSAAVRAGACLALLPRFEPEAALDIIEGVPCTIFEGVPTMYTALLNAESADSRDLSKLRLCLSGGAAIAVETLHAFEEKFGCRVLEGYGLSETSPVASFNHLDRPSKPGSIGTPIWGVEMKIVDAETGKDLPQGEVGEICIRGHNVMQGYHGKPEATAEAIDEKGWFHSGDLGRMDEDGFYFIVDRKKDLIIRGGYNVYPREVEEVLYEHPAIMEVAVVGVPHDELGEEICAVVVPKPGQSVDGSEVQGFVKERLAAYKYPRQVIVADELPKGPTGKILKREIDVAALAEKAGATA